MYSLKVYALILNLNLKIQRHSKAITRFKRPAVY